MAYYTVKGGGGVFATGTASFVNRLFDNAGVLPQPFIPGPRAGVTAPLTWVTLNVMAELAKGPASTHRPSSPNWDRFYRAGFGAPASVDVP